MRGLVAGLLACVPLALGAPPAEGREFAASLCGNSSVTVDIPGKRPANPDENCPGKACHAGTCREKSERDKFDKDQGRKRR